jgi:hypothetical protein
MRRIRVITVIDADKQATANALVKQNIDRGGGQYSFTVPLYDDDGVIQAYWNSASFRAEVYDEVKDNADYNAAVAPRYYADKTPAEVLAIEGLRVGGEE